MKSYPIIVTDACTHNLKNLSCSIPRSKLVVVTGVSGSGKSSLVFDTIVAEAKRRFELVTRPTGAVDGRGGDVTGLSFAVGLSLKESRSQRATVATRVGLYRPLISFFLQRGEPHCPQCGRTLRAFTKQQMVKEIFAKYGNQEISILAPLAHERKSRKTAVAALVRDGYTRIVLDAKMYSINDIDDALLVEAESAAVFIDRITVSSAKKVRLIEALTLALNVGSGTAAVDHNSEILEYPELLRCSTCSLQFSVPTVQSFHSSAIAPTYAVSSMTLGQIFQVTIDEALEWLRTQQGNQELHDVLGTIQRLGLGYISLDRPLRSLSAGEYQRIRIAHAIQSKIHGVLYALDEPTAGLDGENVSTLVTELRKLKDAGASVLVVEHNLQLISAADHVLELGPRAGLQGGTVIAEGSLATVASMNTATGCALREFAKREEKTAQQNKDSDDVITIIGAHKHNLQNITLNISLNQLVAITGVSGSGKSTLVIETLVPALQALIAAKRRARRVQNSKELLKKFDVSELRGWEKIDSVIDVHELGVRITARSTIATAVELFPELRRLFVQTIEARARGLTTRDFSQTSLNSVRDIRFKGLSIADVLTMTVTDCQNVFKNIAGIHRRCKLLGELGLGYLTLSQQVRSLSAGERQRTAIAKWLLKAGHRRTLYVFDEPSRGLHVTEVDVLLRLFQRLIGEGNTVVVIEHNQTILQAADAIIRLGPGAGKRGGRLVT